MSRTSDMGGFPCGGGPLLAPIGSLPLFRRVDYLLAAGSEVTLVLSNIPSIYSGKPLLIFKNGSVLWYGVDYTVAGNVVTLAVALSTSDKLLVDYWSNRPQIASYLIVPPVTYLGFDTAFNANFGYSATNVSNDTAINAFATWYTGRSATSYSDGAGKHWAEVKVTIAGGGTTYFIIGLVDHACTNNSYIGGGIGDDGGQQTQTTMRYEGAFANPGTSNVASTAVNAAIMIHVDQTGTTRKIWMMSSTNGLFIGGGDPATGSNPTFTYIGNLQLHIGVSLDGAAGTCGVVLNTGGAAPINPVSSGYSAWG